MLQQERMAIVDALVADISTTDKEQLRRYLYGLSNEELRKTATTYQTVHTEAARAVEHNPRVIEAQQRLREVEEQLQWSYIFRTPINGRALVDNEANRNFLRSQVDETKGDQISPAWFKQAIAENPGLAKSLAWVSADVLDPKKRQQAAAAQDRADHEVFEETAKRSGLYAINEANWNVLHSVLGSGLNETLIRRAVESGQVGLTPATQEELAAWAQEAAEEKQDFLYNRASPEEAHAIRTVETEQSRQAAQQEFVRKQEQAAREREAASGKGQLPEFNQVTGEKLDSAFFNKLSVVNREEFRRWVTRYGGQTIIDRMRGIR